MGYYRALLTRWSRRDRLAVLVVALAVAFLTGTTLVVLAVGSSTAGIAAEFQATAAVTEHATVAQAQAAAGPDAVVLPLATVNATNGTATVVGIPEEGASGPIDLGGNSTTLGTLSQARSLRLEGSNASVTVEVQPRERSTFPPDWYVTDASTARTLGASNALSVRPADDVPTEGVPVQGALPFFVAGTHEVLAALGIAALVGGVLVGVTVYNVTRMTVRDRVRELFVLRATGTTKWGIRRLFAMRATLLVGIGVAAGYALGVILTNAAINVAVTAGLPTSLDVGVSRQAVRFLLPTYAGVLATGVLAALAAVQPAVRTEPAHLTDSSMKLRLEGLGPRIISARAAVPTAATLAVFVVFLLVVAGLASVAGPLAAADEATITEPGSTHPIASQVPASYAAPLEDRGITASPEILLFAVRDGQPFLARGADYESFAAVSEAHLVEGRTPNEPDEAIVGEDAAETLDVTVGDRIVLGGSVRPRLARVRVVGTFAGEGPTDDQMLVSLSTARHLAGVSDGRVNFIRAERLPETRGTGATAEVSDVTAPGTVPANESFEVAVTIRNDGLEAQTVTRSVTFAGARKPIQVSVPAEAERRRNITFDAGSPGTHQLGVGNVSRSVDVLPRDAVRLRNVPARVPPYSEPLVEVVDAGGAPASNATVTVGNRSMAVRDDGRVRLPFEALGEYEVTVARGDRTDAAMVTVAEDVDRSPRASVHVSPAAPAAVVAPDAVVTLSNPWNETVTRDLTIRGPDVTAQRSVELTPGETIRVKQNLPRRPPGHYEVSVGADGEALASTTYRVTGDDRIISALATGGRSGSTGIGRAAQVAFGNVELALAVLIVLGGAMAIGGTAATFAGAVHANTAVVGLLRAVGSTRREVATVLLGDAFRLGGVAIVAAIVLGGVTVRGLDGLGYLTAYGVRLAARPSFGVFLLVTLGASAVIIGGAFIAAAAVLSSTPAELLREGDQG
jgi:ABC-type lipoprotein release transport system permease subunit